MTSPLKWQTLKTNARWKAGQTVTSQPGEAIDGDGLGALHRIEGDGGARLQVRFVPGDAAAWTERARKVSVLGHPNIVPVVGVGTSEGRAFLVEERPEGESLRRWITRAGRPDLKDVDRVLGAVLAGLRHAHDVSIFHGGLSAACISVARDGVGDFDVRVGGFGLLQSLRDRRATLSPELWDALAPELTDDAKSPDAAADAYAFGVLLVECLTGSLHPPGSRHAWRELAATPNVLRRRLGEAREGIPKSLWDLAAGLLAGDPAARSPKTARDLARSLQRQTWELEEVVAPPPPPRRSDPDELPPARPIGPDVARVVSVSTRRVTEAPAAPTPPPAAPPPAARAPAPTPAPVAHAEDDAPNTQESPAASPPTEEMPAAVASTANDGAATLVDADPVRSNVPRPVLPGGRLSRLSPAPPSRFSPGPPAPSKSSSSSPPKSPPPPPRKTPPTPPSSAAPPSNNEPKTLLDEDPPPHHDGTETLPLGGQDGASTLAYEEEFASEPPGSRSPYGSTQEMKRIKRTPHRDEGAATLPIGVRVDEAATTPRARPVAPVSSSSVAPPAPRPTPEPHVRLTPAPSQVERTLPEAPPRPTPTAPPPERSGFFDDPRLTPPVLAAVALVVVATMGVLGWLAAWAFRP